MTQAGERIQGGLRVGHDLGAEFEGRVRHSGEVGWGGEGTVLGRARGTRHQNGEFKALGRGRNGQMIRDEFGQNSGPGPERHRWSLDFILKVMGFRQRV